MIKPENVIDQTQIFPPWNHTGIDVFKTIQSNFLDL